MNPSARVIFGLALVAVAVALGFGLSHWRREGAQNPGQEQVQSGLQSKKKTIPGRVPDFVLKDSNNQPRSPADWAGKSLVVNFWATWCPPCLREIPLLNALQTERSKRNFQVVGIAIDRRADVLAYMQKAQLAYPVLIGEQEAIEVAERFGVSSIALPFTVFADDRGRVVTLRLGELDAEEANGILDVIQSVNDGGLTLEQAKERIVELAHHH